MNYGYVEGVMVPDGEELDAYALKVSDPVQEFTGICVAIIYRKDDADDKLIIVPEGMDVTDDEIWEMTKFQEQYFESEIVRE